VPGSTPEKVFTDINGLRQGMFIQGKNATHPVLLYLHGGLPEYFLTERHPTGLGDDFTVAWWEQRGAGLSWRPGIPPESMPAEQFIADTLAVTDYLRDRFGKDKIYLMAHSGGTFIGLQAAARAPQAYCAYIGVAQMVRQRRLPRQPPAQRPARRQPRRSPRLRLRPLPQPAHRLAATLDELTARTTNLDSRSSN
jgi:pimeloyl-ACP methyl ester carboxylesterase